jgi:hypothetical protein
LASDWLPSQLRWRTPTEDRCGRTQLRQPEISDNKLHIGPVEISFVALKNIYKALALGLVALLGSCGGGQEPSNSAVPNAGVPVSVAGTLTVPWPGKNMPFVPLAKLHPELGQQPERSSKGFSAPKVADVPATNVAQTPTPTPTPTPAGATPQGSLGSSPAAHSAPANPPAITAAPLAAVPIAPTLVPARAATPLVIPGLTPIPGPSPVTNPIEAAVSGVAAPASIGAPLALNHASWHPAVQATPGSGNYVYLESDKGEHIGGGVTSLYTASNAQMEFIASGGTLLVRVGGAQKWEAAFQTMDSLQRLQPGYYGVVSRHGVHNRAIGGMNWMGEGRQCNALNAWFAVDRVQYQPDGELAAIELRFEQRCQGAKEALRGSMRWAAEKTGPAPVASPPPGPWSPPASAALPPGNFVYLQSEAGDYIGQGRTHTYTQRNAVLHVWASSARTAEIRVSGDETWYGRFTLPDSVSQFQIGVYRDVSRFEFFTPAAGALDWGGEGRGCNDVSGWFVVDSVRYRDGVLSAISLRFEQRCGGSQGVLRGQINWTVADTSGPPGPVVPPPTDLWTPPAGIAPQSGNYVLWVSDAGDYIGQGATYTATHANAQIGVFGTYSGRGVSVSVNGDDWWGGDFAGMSSIAELQPGFYANTQRAPFHNPAFGGLNWTGSGRGCNTSTGWFAVDRIERVNGAISVLEVRFEQHCEGVAPALRGKIRWHASDVTGAPGPVNPPPANLWQPPVFSPGNGSYAYLESEAGDPIGQGATLTLTPANSRFTMAPAWPRGASLSIHGDRRWRGELRPMNSLTQLQPGYYGNLGNGFNAVMAFMSWSADGIACTAIPGWFAIDEATYTNGALTTLEFRFEQRCPGQVGALRGKVRWIANDPTVPPGPAGIPPTLWAPNAVALPTSGSYVYLESEPGDPVGQGVTRLFTRANSYFDDSPQSGPKFALNIHDGQWRSLNFATMYSLAALQTGFYNGLKQYPFHNPAVGGLEWRSTGNSCSGSSGWVAIDSVSYANAQLASVEFRFEQRCAEGSGALRGKVRWLKNDPTGPAGPGVIPSSLWVPPPGAIASSATNYLYLESQPGDPAGSGLQALLTPSNAGLWVSHGYGSGGLSGPQLTVSANDGRAFYGELHANFGSVVMQPGYYANLGSPPDHNRAFGGIRWFAGIHCETTSGWFAIDSVTITNGSVSNLELRFAQYCNGATAPLNGKIKWSAPPL